MTDDPLAAFTCDDCSTVAVVLHEVDEIGLLVAVQHDQSCPWYAALTDEQRTTMTDAGALVHIGEPD